MINWHLSTCRRPDVMFLDDIGAPSCLNCGEVGTIDAPSSAAAARKPPETPQQSGFDLHWPSSLSFVEDLPSSNGSLEETRPEGGTSVSTEKTIATPGMSLYEPLYARKIRLLRLLSGEFHDPIRCELRTVNLHSRPEYEALSYTWADSNGDSSLSQIIYVGERYNILMITVNCANALRRLRFPSRSRTLWVDAICIDQCNVHERSHQVGMMRNIYATAKRVIIYLGEDPKDPNLKSCTPWQYDNREDTLGNISDRPYFSRAWVIQEIASAGFAWVLYGSKGAIWRDIVTPEGTEGNKSTSLKKGYDAQLVKLHPWLQFVKGQKHRSLDEFCRLLFATSSCQTSDPRDKVFALLGLSLETAKIGLVPNYNLSRAQVIAGTTAFVLQQNPEFWVACFARMNPHHSQNTPSWVVDWTISHQETQASHQISSQQCVPLRAKGQLSQEDYKPRFNRAGVLLMKGVHLLDLHDCLLSLSASSSPPGVISLYHEPTSPSWQREAIINNSNWAGMTDKLFLMKELPDHLLILRPTENTTKHSFVAIARLEYGSTALIVNSIDRRKSLLFTAWNELLGHTTNVWHRPQTWEDVEDVCRIITDYRDLTKGLFDMTTLAEPSKVDKDITEDLIWLRLRSDLAEKLRGIMVRGPLADRFRAKPTFLNSRNQVRRYLRPQTQYHLSSQLHYEPSLASRGLSGVKNLSLNERASRDTDFGRFLAQASWDFGAKEDFIDERPAKSENDLRLPERVTPWHPDYFDGRSTDRLREVLRKVLGIDIKGFKWSPSSSSTSPEFLRQLLSQNLEYRAEAFDKILNEYKKTRSMGDSKGNVESEAEGIEVLRWLRNSMELHPNRMWHPDQDLNWTPHGSQTWLDLVCEVWSALDVDEINGRQSWKWPGKIPNLQPNSLARFRGMKMFSENEFLNPMFHRRKSAFLFLQKVRTISADMRLWRATFPNADLAAELSCLRRFGIDKIEKLRPHLPMFKGFEPVLDALDRLQAVQRDLEKNHEKIDLEKIRDVNETLERVLTQGEQSSRRFLHVQGWKTLFELVEETRAHLLPLEDALISYDALTHIDPRDLQSEDLVFEDVHII